MQDRERLSGEVDKWWSFYQKKKGRRRRQKETIRELKEYLPSHTKTQAHIQKKKRKWNLGQLPEITENPLIKHSLITYKKETELGYIDKNDSQRWVKMHQSIPENGDTTEEKRIENWWNQLWEKLKCFWINKWEVLKW